MRSIRPQTVTLAVLAILFGLGAAWAAKQVLLYQQEVPVVQAVAPPPEPVTQIVVLQANLPKDSRLVDSNVGQVVETLAHLNERKVPLDKAIKFKQQAMGRILKVSKSAGSWLTEDDFYEMGKGPELKIKDGYRAVTLRVDDPAVSASIVRTGCLVDVFLTAENPDDGIKRTVRVASAVEVVSPPVREGGAPNSVTSVSGKSYIVLAATPKQSYDLTLAQKMDEGTISVTLCSAPSSNDGTRIDVRPPNTIAVTPTNSDYSVTERELLGLPPPRSPPPPPAPPERIVVEEIRGNKIDYVVFTGDSERLSEAEARQDSMPDVPASGAVTTGKKAPRCLECEKRARKARRQGGGLIPPLPGATPNPTPAPGGFHDGPSPELVPVPPKTT